VRSGRRWLLLAGDPDRVRLNGAPLPLGIRALRDRDEIRVSGLGATFYTTETLATVVAFPGPTSVPCGRCQVAIREGEPAVACPGCGVFHHSGPCADGVERPCWIYAERCAFCPQPTALDAGFRWTPEDM
jgi:hypothetical protein